MSSAARHSSSRSSVPSAQDVALDAGEQADARVAIQRADTRGMGQRPPLVEPVGHGEGLAVVGDGDVLETRVVRGLCHGFDGVFAVGFGRVRVEIATQVRPLDE